MNPLVRKRSVLLILSLAFCFAFVVFPDHTGLFAQAVGGGGVQKPGPKPPAVPAPAQPKAQPEVPKSVGEKKALTTKDYDEARQRRMEKLRRAVEEALAGTQPAQPGSGKPLPTAGDIRFLSPRKGEVKVLATGWRTEARGGEKPFTLLTVKVLNLSDSYISIHDMNLDTPNAEPLDVNDPRGLPAFPMALGRFSDTNRLPAPIPPGSQQAIVFTLPYAMKSSSVLRSSVGRYLKFQTDLPLDLEPVRVVEWRIVPTVSGGVGHKGLFVTVENRAAAPVTAKLKVTVDGLPLAGGKTFFLAQVSVREEQKRTLLLRTIPNEGALPGDPGRETLAPDFSVRSIEVVDFQY